MSETKHSHSPTPWSIGGVYGTYVVDADRKIICEISIADTKFIVRAVNSHEALVAACEEALDFCNDIGDGAPDAGSVPRTANFLTIGLRNALDRANAKGGAS